MMYPFLTLDDGTEIVHSEMHSDGTVKVYMEKPDAKDGFHHAHPAGAVPLRGGHPLDRPLDPSLCPGRGLR